MITYLVKIYPPINKIINKIESILKYLSMKYRTFSPNLMIKMEIRKNLEDLLTKDAIKNKGNDILNAPAVIVNIL